MNIFIIDAGCQLHGHGGSLNHHYVNLAKDVLTAKGYTVVITKVEDNYDVETERDKILAADTILLQTPAWWMSPPWQFKKYQDYVFGGERLIYGDGRSRKDPSLLYGSGGKCVNKRYMISCTWNAPLEAFTEPNQFFEGKGIDTVFMGVHKAFQFMGLTPLPTFMSNDVIKNPTHEQDFIRFKDHLEKYIN